MKRLFLTLLLLTSAVGLFAQSGTIYSTTFPSPGPPSGWTTQILGFEAETDWYYGSSYLPGAGSFNSPAAIFNDDMSFDDQSWVRLVSPAFDVSGFDTVSLSFDYGLSIAEDQGGTFTVEVFNGTTWQQVLFKNTHTPPTSSGAIDVTAYKNSQFQVRFTYNDQFTYSWGAGVANFNLSGTYTVIPNDLISGAFMLTCGQTSTSTTNTATAETGLPVCNGVNGNTKGVWYKFSDPMYQSTVTVSACATTGSLDTRLSVFKGPQSALECVTANDNTCGNLSTVTFDYDGYSEYYVLVSGAGDTTGDFTIAATCVPIVPPNDEIANAYDVDTYAQPYVDHAVQFMYATGESQAFDYLVNGCDIGTMPYVWYKFTATANGTAQVILPTPSPGGLNLIQFYSAANESATIPQLSWVNQASNACNVMGDERQITITAGTTYYVAITLEGGNSDVQVILTYDCTTPEAPQVTENQSFCGTSTVAQLAATGAEGATVNWYATEGGTALESTTSVSTGTYYVTQTVANCESEPVSVVVTVNAIPDAPQGTATQTFTAGQTVADLVITTTEGATVTWYVKNDADVYTAVATDTELVNTTTYYATQTINGCESGYLAVTASQISGTEGFTLNSFTAYPNPATDVVTVSGNATIKGISIYNLVGQLVITQKADSNEVVVSTAALQQGTYLLNVETENGTKTLKISKL